MSTHTLDRKSTTTGNQPIRRAALWITILACLPYLTLKVTWIFGGEIGIPPGSELLDPENDTSMKALNGLTVFMDSAVILLALVFARGLGQRIPAWLVAGPAWVATGLLGPIVVGYPFSVAVELADHTEAQGDGWLEPWVFTLVYGGFLVQALGLGTLFAGYADRRWGVIWRGRLPELEHRGILPALQVAAVAAVVVAVLPLAVRVGRISGLIDDLSLREKLTEGLHIPFILAGLVGIQLLGFGRAHRVRLRSVLHLTWAGSAVMVTTSLWMLLTLSTRSALPDGLTPFDQLCLALTLASGLLIVTASMAQLAVRADGRSTTGVRLRPEHAAELPRQAG